MANELNRSSWLEKSWLRQTTIIVAIYMIATWFTNPWLMGDSIDYVDSVFAADQGRNLVFWEFGHLLWRPLAWVAYKCFGPIAGLVVGPDPRAKITFTLISINWVAGLALGLLLRELIARVCQKEWVVTLATVGLLLTSAFLNYGQTGSAYVPGIALALAAACILVRDREHGHQLKNAVMAGVLVAFAIGLWFPFVLLVPAALTVPLFIFDWNKNQLRAIVYAGLASGVCILLAYVIVVRHIGISSFAELKLWVTAASHGMDHMRGVPRMIFGFANSFIDLSGDGAVFKRYLKHDPFNPVSLTDIFRFSLWKLVFVYVFLSCVLLNLVRTKRGRWIIVLLAVDLAPTVFFALFIFEAGDMSRYIMVLPIIYIAVGASLCSEKSIAWTRYVIILFIVVSAFVNYRAMSASVLSAREARVEMRIKELVPLLKPESRVITSHLQDDINNFTRDFLFNATNLKGTLRYYAVAPINGSQIETWREDFARVAIEEWRRGGDLWLSRRMLSPRPRVEWNWVEGDDPRISWTHLYDYFTQFDLGQSVGGDDGFVKIMDTPRNREILERTIREGKKTNSK